MTVRIFKSGRAFPITLITCCMEISSVSTRPRRRNSTDIVNLRQQIFRQASGAHGLDVHAGDPYPTLVAAGGVHHAPHLLHKVQTGPTTVNGNCNG